MKAQNISVRILAALFVYAATQLSAEAGLPTIEPVTSFGPFPFGDNTFPRSINSNRDIAGTTGTKTSTPKDLFGSATAAI